MRAENIKPTRGRVLVRKEGGGKGMMNGMLVPETVKGKIPSTQGKVEMVGSGVKKVRVGDSVVFGLGSGYEVGTFVILKEKDVVCKVS